MDYLVYVERDAESLQFFLWYCDYISDGATCFPGRKLCLRRGTMTR